MNTLIGQFQSRLVTRNTWKFFCSGWLTVNAVFLIYLILSYNGLFSTYFPRVVKLLDSEVFLRAAAISSLIFTFLSCICRRQLILLLAAIEENYHTIVDNSEQTTSHWVFDSHSGLDRLFRVTAFVISIFLVYHALTNTDYYFFLIKEDSIVETASSLLWFTAVITTLVTIYFGYQKGISLTFYIVLTLFFFACGGEEISWGQRLYQIETPEILSRINVQDETTLHNIGSTSLFSNAFFLITVIFFLLIPRLQLRVPGFTHYQTHFGLPVIRRGAVIVYQIGLVAWLIVGIRYGTLGFHPFTLWDYYRQLDDELFEMMAALSFLTFSALNLEGSLRSKK